MTRARDVEFGRHRDRNIGLWFFATASCFYLLCTSGHIYTPDGVIMLQVTEGIVERGDASIAGLAEWQGFGGSTVAARSDGAPRFYAKYGLGLSLAAIPTYTLGRLLVPFLDQRQLGLFRIPDTEGMRNSAYARHGTIIAAPDEDFRWLWYDPRAAGSREGFLAYCAAWTNSLVVAGVLLGVFLIGIEIGYEREVALAVAIVAGIATPLWAYAKDFFSEPLAALALTYFFYFALRSCADVHALRWWALAGLALGLASLAKPALIVLTIPASVLLVGYTHALPRRRQWDSAAAFGAGVGSMVMVTLLYDFLRFGSILETGYGAEAGQWTMPFFWGLLGLLVSPGRGLLIYFPIWLLLLPSGPIFSIRRRIELTFILASLGTMLALYAKWHQWEGGICWGPRFMIPVIPILVIPIGSLLSQGRSHRDVRLATAMIVAISTAIAFSGTWVNYFEYSNWVKWQVLSNAKSFAARGVTSAYQLFLFDIHYAPIGGYWTFPRKDGYFIFDAMREPGLVLGVYGVFALGFSISATLLWRAMSQAGESKGFVSSTTNPTPL